MNIPVVPDMLTKLNTGFLATRHGHLIDGQWRPSRSGKTFPVYNPATGEIIAHVAEGDADDISDAVAAARRAFNGSWSRLTGAERAKLLWRLSDLIEKHADELALIETLDNGKPLRGARSVDVASAIDVFRYISGWCTRITGETHTTAGEGTFAYTLREPVGVAGLIVPWNYPLMITAQKIAPALAAGCTVVLKPAEQTPLTALRLGELILEAGFPEGVVNIVTGTGEGAGAPLVEHPDVNKISFTGSTSVGKSIVRAAAGTLKRVTLELGGKSPIVIFPDADLSQAIPNAAATIFSNAGQICIANSRLYAHQSIFDRVVEEVANRAKTIKLGPGIQSDTEMGPLVSDVQKARVTGYIESGKSEGAHVVAGGDAFAGAGYFVQPTVLTGTNPNMKVMREEIFGPVLCAMSFSDNDLDAIAAEANNTNYGLSASLWTRDVSVVHKMARKIKSGMVRVNGGGLANHLPFGGFKQSGWGREGGREGVDSYLETKLVTMAL